MNILELLANELVDMGFDAVYKPTGIIQFRTVEVTQPNRHDTIVMDGPTIVKIDQFVDYDGKFDTHIGFERFDLADPFSLSGIRNWLER